MFRVLTSILLTVAVVNIREDPPVASRSARGDVTGQIRPADKVEKLYAVSRVTGKKYKPGQFDKKSGKFRFRNLPGDAIYDVGIVTKNFERIEGIDLSWHEARLQRLADVRRKQLKLPAEQKREFTRKDADELIKYVKDLKDFCNVRRVLYIKSAGLRATMLAETMRVREFHAQRGDEVIWRIELWYFRYRYGGWERMGNVERLLERRRIQAAEWKAITLVYYPALSAYVDEKGKSRPVKFTIPDRLDLARGRIAGTNPIQKTKPIIIGLTATTRPTTQTSRPAE